MILMPRMYETTIVRYVQYLSYTRVILAAVLQFLCIVVIVTIIFGWSSFYLHTVILYHYLIMVPVLVLDAYTGTGMDGSLLMLIYASIAIPGTLYLRLAYSIAIH